MRIITPGRIPKDWTHQADCEACGCVFEFATSEAQSRFGVNSGDFLNVSCPTCKVMVSVPVKKPANGTGV